MVPVDDTPGSTNTDEKFECACQNGYRQDFRKSFYSRKFYFFIINYESLLITCVNLLKWSYM